MYLKHLFIEIFMDVVIYDRIKENKRKPAFGK